MPTSPNKVIIKRDRHVGLRDKVDLATPPTGACRRLAAVLHLTAVLIPILIDPERRVVPRSATPHAPEAMARLDQ